jgi:hypothetical protein
VISPRRGACATGFGPHHEQARLGSGFAFEPHAGLARLAPVAPCANAPKPRSRCRRDPAGADAASAWGLSAWCFRRVAPPSPGKRLPRDAIHRRRTKSTTAPRSTSPKPAHAPPGTTTWRTVVSARGVKSQAQPQPSPLDQSDPRSRRGALAHHCREGSMPRLPSHATLSCQSHQPPTIIAAPQRRNAMSHQSHCSRGAVSLT